eukprot:SAG11_NODE_1450_length_4883_cov_2.373955_4_plen_52_part_00
MNMIEVLVRKKKAAGRDLSVNCMTVGSSQSSAAHENIEEQARGSLQSEENS